MAKIEWWLLKHESNYSYVKAIENIKNTFEVDGKDVILPSLQNPPSEEERFICLFEALEKLSQLHKNENYFKQEMAIYISIKENTEKLKLWLVKNEVFGADKYVCFLVDYLDYLGNGEEYHLNVFLEKDRNFNLFVDREDFKHTVDFLETFNEHYWG